MAFRPLEDRVLVKRNEADEVTEGGIVVPDTVDNRPFKGVVVAVGTGKVLEDGTFLEVGVNEGETVLFGKHAGVEIKLGGEVHIILRESELLGVEE